MEWRICEIGETMLERVPSQAGKRSAAFMQKVIASVSWSSLEKKTESQLMVDTFQGRIGGSQPFQLIRFC